MMSYSAFFTAGLTLASQPRDYDYSFTKLPPLQANVHPSTSRRTRKRRSSLTLATSPINTIKSPARTANDVARTPLRTVTVSPRDGTFFDPLHNGTRPRRKTLSNPKDLPSLPAPTSPLPTIPNLRIDVPRDMAASSMPFTPIDDVYSPSPTTLDSPRPSYQPGSLRSNPARKSSFLLPMVVRGALLSSAFASNIIPDENMMKQDLETDNVKMTPEAEWYEDEDMKENDGDV